MMVDKHIGNLFKLYNKHSKFTFSFLFKCFTPPPLHISLPPPSWFTGYMFPYPPLPGLVYMHNHLIYCLFWLPFPAFLVYYLHASLPFLSFIFHVQLFIQVLHSLML